MNEDEKELLDSELDDTLLEDDCKLPEKKLISLEQRLLEQEEQE